MAGFISVVPKLAALASLLRLLLVALPVERALWLLAIGLLAVATMTLGNLSSRCGSAACIAQAGYLLIGVAASARGEGAVLAVGFYLLSYPLMNLGAFFVVAVVERHSGTDGIAAVRGSGRRAPAATAALTLELLSLAGIPPLAGFVGKVLLPSAAVDAGMTWLAAIAVVNMVIGLYYYAVLIAGIHFAREGPATSLLFRAAYVVVISLCTLGTIAFGIAPSLALHGFGHMRMAGF